MGGAAVSSQRLDENVARPIPEDVRVRRWRRSQFAELGFDPSQTRLLANSGADLGVARELIGRGCATPTAFAILR